MGYPCQLDDVVKPPRVQTGQLAQAKTLRATSNSLWAKMDASAGLSFITLFSQPFPVTLEPGLRGFTSVARTLDLRGGRSGPGPVEASSGSGLGRPNPS
jgi:hypothetical protein